MNVIGYQHIIYIKDVASYGKSGDSKVLLSEYVHDILNTVLN